ncbi:UNVERIFIED_CONTAM: hypothetical protein Sradi_4557100 [Sesamum radiatum]|uniref:Uncharacterized protein n=1 Tax=Sesamum radiatum TaxID=300843 RepID=A0AAW2NBS7_SESRA
MQKERCNLLHTETLISRSYFYDNLIPVEALMAAAGSAVERGVFAGGDELLAPVHRIWDLKIMDLLTLCVDNLRLVLDHLPVEIAVAATYIAFGRRPALQVLLATVSLTA